MTFAFTLHKFQLVGNLAILIVSVTCYKLVQVTKQLTKTSCEATNSKTLGYRHQVQILRQTNH